MHFSLHFVDNFFPNVLCACQNIGGDNKNTPRHTHCNENAARVCLFELWFKYCITLGTWAKQTANNYHLTKHFRRAGNSVLGVYYAHLTSRCTKRNRKQNKWTRERVRASTLYWRPVGRRICNQIWRHTVHSMQKKKESKIIKASTNGIFNLLESTLNRNYISWEPIYLHDLFGDLFIDSKLLFDLGAHSHTQAHWFYSPFTLLIFKFSLHFAQFM